MDLSDAELMAIYDTVYNEAYYGDDEVVYGNSPYSIALRTALAKVEDETKRRGL